MVKILTKEYRDGNLAVKTTEITFLCIPIFRYKKTTTNNKAIALLSVIEEAKKIKGFNNETED